MKMRTIYNRGDISDGIHIITRGVTSVEFPGFEPLNLPHLEMAAGCLEYFLAERPLPPLPRLFDLRIQALGAKSFQSYEYFEKHLSGFRYGVICNRFLSAVLQAINECYRKLSINPPPEVLQHQLRARVFAELVEDIFDVWSRVRARELYSLGSKARQQDLFEEGEVILREVNITHLPLAEAPIRRYTREFPADSYLCKEGDPAGEAFVLLEGKIGVLVEGRYVAWITEPGEAFGEVAMFLEDTRTASLIADENSLVYVIEKDRLEEFHSDHPRALQAIAKTLAKRFKRTYDRIALLSASTPTSQSEQFEVSEEGRKQFDL
ncbi:MAG: cyclic nucleotide-binding domain-containing protein, partial [Bdellovibrionales bacterium]|nr:cyclic nucleotide-binding domain-containing protein [Bdellovibrionales bacterium]